MFEFEENLEFNAKIKVVGVGGGGGNALKTMVRAQIDDVDFIAVNTDIQSLRQNEAPVKIQIGHKLTRGLGAGANPGIGRDAALEDLSLIKEAVSGSDLVFITAGMGGGTGTGAAPVIAKVARDLGILTIGIVTKPFSFEGRKRMRQAEDGLNSLKEAVDTLICIPNDNLLNLASKETPMTDSFKMADQVLLHAVKAVTDLVTIPGLINLDLADMRSVMAGAGYAMMGTGVSSGANRAVEAAKMALASPLLGDLRLQEATGVILNITGSSAMTLFEVNEACRFVQDSCHKDVNILFGSVHDESMQDRIRITLIATGFTGVMEQKPIQPPMKTIAAWAELPIVEPIQPETVTPFVPQILPADPLTEITNIELKTDILEPAKLDASKPEDNNNQLREMFAELAKEREPELPLFAELISSEVKAPQVTTPAPSPISYRETPSPWGVTSETMPPRAMRPMGTRAPESSGGLGLQQAELDSLPIVNIRRQMPDKAGIRKMIADVGLNDASDDKYDIPAFIRKRAD
jgi:cell division protein FtsZ